MVGRIGRISRGDVDLYGGDLRKLYMDRSDIARGVDNSEAMRYRKIGERLRGGSDPVRGLIGAINDAVVKARKKKLTQEQIIEYVRKHGRYPE